MSWLVIALLAAAVGAIVSIFDKTVIHRYARSPLTLPLLIGIAQTTVGVVVLAAVRAPDGAALSAVGWSLLSGVLFGLSGQALIRVLFVQEVSRTIPVMQTSPIFAAFIGILFLDEALSGVQWAAIAATVSGAAFLSLRLGGVRQGLFFHRSFFVLVAAAGVLAAANVAGKAALDDLPVLFTHGLRSVALGGVFLVFNVRSVPIADVRGFVSSRSPALLLVAANELLIANAGLLLLLWALSLGPVALVTALVGTRALFVVFYSTALALVWKGALGEETTRGAIAVKTGSTALIVAGVAMMAV